MAKAYGQMSEVLGGPQGYANRMMHVLHTVAYCYRLLQYMMIRNGTYKELALANAMAINGLQPKITVWNTGEGSSTESSNPIRNLMQNLPPMLSTIHEQTGIAPPGWLAQMSTQSQSQNQNQNQNQTLNSGKGKINSY